MARPPLFLIARLGSVPFVTPDEDFAAPVPAFFLGFLVGGATAPSPLAPSIDLLEIRLAALLDRDLDALALLLPVLPVSAVTADMLLP